MAKEQNINMSNLILIFKDKKLIFVYNPCICACETSLNKKEVQMTFNQKQKLKDFCILNNIKHIF